MDGHRRLPPLLAPEPSRPGIGDPFTRPEPNTPIATRLAKTPLCQRQISSCSVRQPLEYPNCDPFGENSPLSEANLLVFGETASQNIP